MRCLLLSVHRSWRLQFPQKRAAAPKRARDACHSSSSSSSKAAAAAAAVDIKALSTSQALVSAVTGASGWRTASLLAPPTKQPRMMAKPSGFGHQENQFLNTYQEAFSYFFAVERDIRGNQ
jgi:hypothetical protein